jgi:hypothetical protein
MAWIRQQVTFETELQQRVEAHENDHELTSAPALREILSARKTKTPPSKGLTRPTSLEMFERAYATGKAANDFFSSLTPLINSHNENPHSAMNMIGNRGYVHFSWPGKRHSWKKQISRHTPSSNNNSPKALGRMFDLRTR